MAVVSSLVDFVLARVAEDEAVARAASVGTHWTWDDRQEAMYSDSPTTYGHECIIDTEGANPPGPEPGAHIARHDPARVLAQCAAIRAVVDRVRYEFERQTNGWHTAQKILGDIASIWSEHPEFQQEWAS